MAPWSYYAGRRASPSRPSSRVRVYERPDIPGRIMMSRAWVTTDSGRPVEDALEAGTTRERAKRLADLTAAKREMRILDGRAAERVAAEEVTLERLLKAYHESRQAERWSEAWATNKDTYRRAWLDRLGKDRLVTGLTTARAEKAAGEMSSAGGWSPSTERKYLQYLRAAVTWGRDKAQLYPDSPLRGLELPSPEPDTTGLVYELAEIRRLVRPHPKVDWRCTLAASIAYDTGRRISAIRQLTRSDVSVAEGRLYLHFGASTDKSRQASVVAVSRPTAELVLSALERGPVQAHGQLFPGGDLGRHEAFLGAPITASGMGALLCAAEVALEIPHVPRRGWHGIKRRHVTESWEIAGGDAALVGDVTGNRDPGLLREVYRRQRRSRTTEQVDRVRAALEEAEGDDA